MIAASSLVDSPPIPIPRREDRGASAIVDLTLPWIDVPERRRERGDLFARIFRVPPLGRRRVVDEPGIRPPRLRRPDRPRDEAAAAIRADVPKHGGDTVGAEGAFVGADARL